MSDLLLLSKEYEKVIIPAEKRFLFKYFKTDQQRSFLKYFYVFKDRTFFSEHTGIPCTKEWLKLMEERYLFIDNLYNKSRKEFDLALIAKINSGRVKFDQSEQTEHDGFVII